MNEISKRTETVLPEPARALGALVGVPVPDLARGEGLPLLWHWLQALAMAEAARAAGYRGDQDGARLRFDYRLTAPLFDYQGMMVGPSGNKARC